MDEPVKKGIPATPILFPMEPEMFWDIIRSIVREELANVEKTKPTALNCETPGLTYKPLYRIVEVCQIFQITKPTVYDWVSRGKLKPYKIRSRVYFLWQDIQKMLTPQTDVQ